MTFWSLLAAAVAPVWVLFVAAILGVWFWVLLGAVGVVWLVAWLRVYWPDTPRRPLR